MPHFLDWGNIASGHNHASYNDFHCPQRRDKTDMGLFQNTFIPWSHFISRRNRGDKRNERKEITTENSGNTTTVLKDDPLGS